MDELPQGIIHKILSKLPLKSVLRLGCVSKSWSQIVHNPCNMQVHSQPLIIMGIKVNHFFVNTIMLHAAVESEVNKMIHVSKNPVMKSEITVYGSCAVGSCNGLLYFAEYCHGGAVLVFNPLTGDKVRIPRLLETQCFVPPSTTTFGLGFDDKTKTFKMVCTYCRRSSYGGGLVGTLVYNFGTKLWKQIPKGPKYQMCDKSVFVHGSLFWKVSSLDQNFDNMITSFDVGKEEFGLIPHPKNCSMVSELFDFFDLNNELALADLSNARKIDVWLMDSVTREWRKEFSIGMTAPRGKEDNMGIEVISHWKDDEILMISCEGHWIYSMKTGELKYKQISGFDSKAMIYCFRGSLIHFDS